MFCSTRHDHTREELAQVKISFFFEKFLFDVQLTVNVGDCQEFGRLIFGRKIVGFTHT
jgi:hypothetical protein